MRPVAIRDAPSATKHQLDRVSPTPWERRRARPTRHLWLSDPYRRTNALTPSVSGSARVFDMIRHVEPLRRAALGELQPLMGRGTA